MAHSERVPKPMQERFESLCEATDAFSDAHLNGEYTQMIRYPLRAFICPVLNKGGSSPRVTKS